jgi:hypothetical protein
VTGSRRWWWRLAGGVLSFAVIEATIRLIHGEADELRLALVVALVVGGVAVLLDASLAAPAVWTTRVDRESGLGRLDPRTASNLRILEGHLSAKEADGALQGRLRELSDQTLRARQDMSAEDPRAEELLGHELSRLVSGPPRRLHLEEIERCVSRIEEL